MTGKQTDGERLNRRRFLKSATATAAGFAATAASGTAAAGAVPAGERTASVREARSALDAHAGDVLATLEDDGVFDAADATRLASAGDASLRTFDGDYSEELRVKLDVDGGFLDVAVERDDGRAYAFYYPDDEDTRYLYRTDGERFDVGTDNCCKTDCYCTHTVCSAACYERCNVCCLCGQDNCSWEEYCDECIC
ncbi:hypothetical protein [Halorussus caseinilyticus]|uniref:Twin-arginine translocation signal domain-containing protein n=1 Tax=Halorussus caseinilyticus TaxID=3034025 RepID=A0ABD5WRC1_9EURY|nr:hypothetical protein [Halorussus sp. DT72]